jgi:hypothetical protein
VKDLYPAYGTDEKVGAVIFEKWAYDPNDPNQADKLGAVLECRYESGRQRYVSRQWDTHDSTHRRDVGPPAAGVSVDRLEALLDRGFHLLLGGGGETGGIRQDLAVGANHVEAGDAHHFVGHGHVGAVE